MIELTHPAVSYVTTEAWKYLLDGCNKSGTFFSRLDRLAKRIAGRPDSEASPYYCHGYSNLPLSGLSVSYKFKGDVFEIICGEGLIKVCGANEGINVYDYIPIVEGDVGADGVGVTKSNLPTAVQLKYGPWDEEIHHVRKRLDNFDLTARNIYKVDTQARPGRLLVITSAKQMNWKTIERYGGCMRCLSRDANYGCLKGAPPGKNIENLFSLKTILDEHLIFWDTMREQVGL